MTLKTLFALLTISVLATFAVAVDDASSSEGSAEVSSPKKFATKEFGKIVMYGIEHGKEVFEKTIKELAPAKEKNEALGTKLEKFTDFIEEAGKVEPVKEDEPVEPEAFHVFSSYLDIVNAFNTSRKDVETNKETTLIWTTLVAEGIDEVEDGMMTRFDKFFEEFYKKFEEYKKSWTPEQEKSHKELVTKLKDIYDTTAFDEKFTKYFKLFMTTLKKKSEHHH